MMNKQTGDDLAAQAEAAERLGRPEANELWSALLSKHPEHPRALFRAGWLRLQGGDPDGALRSLQQSEAADPEYADTPLFAAIAHRQQGDYPAALAALERALAIDPYSFTAMLSKGSILEQIGRPRQAAQVFANVLKIAPPREVLPPQQRAALDHARATVAANAEKLAAFLRERTMTARAGHASAHLNRFDESLAILAGLNSRQVQDPLFFYFPQLPAIPFYPRKHFPWLPQLEAGTSIIRDELTNILREDREKFEPYMQLPAGAPVNQWEELNHSLLWSTLHLWRDGARSDEVCARCPKTAALMESLPLAWQNGYGPTVVFSVLSPHTHIPAHTGSTNIRLLTHLPIILPPDCRFRVGNETRPWREGEAWVFDDTIEHEAWNDSAETRVILIFDVWNPLITEAERALVTEMLVALKDYNAG